MTIILARHGSREPGTLVPVHNTNDLKLIIDFGLTNLGARQEYFLGRYLEKKFKHFFNITPASIAVRSTDRSRTIQSAQALLLGITEKSSNSIFNPIEDVNESTPISISQNAYKIFEESYWKIAKFLKHPVLLTSPTDDSQFFSFGVHHCPAIKSLKKEYYKTSESKKRYAKFKELAGPTLKKFHDLENFTKSTWILLTKNILFYYYLNLPMKTIVSVDEIKILQTAEHHYLLSEGFGNPKIRKLGTHNFFNEVLELFDLALLRDSSKDSLGREALSYHRNIGSRDPAYYSRYNWLKNNAKLAKELRAVIYMNHDTFLYAVLSSISQTKHQDFSFPTAGMLKIELYKENTDYYIKLLYNEKNIDLVPCFSNKCPLKDFIKMVQKNCLYSSESEYQRNCAGKINEGKK